MSRYDGLQKIGAIDDMEGSIAIVWGEEIAGIAHEVNRVYCESLGDTSQPLWKDAPQWQKDSAIDGVKFHIGKWLRKEPMNPADSHNNWLKHKYADGWRYGPAKDASIKEHPCCVPYEELPHEQQVKDKLFATVVRTFLDLTK